MVGASSGRSALYVGWLRHRRVAPVEHQFTYPLFMVLLDIDCVPAVMSRSRFSSYNRWNVAAFDERDHFGDPRLPLRDRLRADAERAGVSLPSGQVLLLTHLRYLGYCFNPVSFYYCFDAAGSLRHVMAEVNNTYGESRNYWLTADSTIENRGPHPVHFSAHASKALYVSPFMNHDLDYTFQLTRPLEQLVVHMTVTDRSKGAQLFDATLSLDRRPWTAAEFRAALWRFPLMTAKVMAAIHWQALRLWRKGVPVVPRVAVP